MIFTSYFHFIQRWLCWNTQLTVLRIDARTNSRRGTFSDPLRVGPLLALRCQWYTPLLHPIRGPARALYIISEYISTFSNRILSGRICDLTRSRTSRFPYPREAPHVRVSDGHAPASPAAECVPRSPTTIDDGGSGAAGREGCGVHRRR